MTTLKDLLEKVYEVEETYAGHDEWPVQRLMKLTSRMSALVENELEVELADPTTEEAFRLRKRTNHRTADLLCELLIFARRNNIDLEGALEEKWMRDLSNRAPERRRIS